MQEWRGKGKAALKEMEEEVNSLSEVVGIGADSPREK